MRPIKSHPGKTLILSLRDYTGAAVLSVLIVIPVLQLWKADLHVPFCYEGDGLLHASLVKGLIDNGWYWRNSFLGAPDGLQIYDFPAIDNLSLVLMKLISVMSSNYGVVLNLFFLFTFPLTAICSLYAFRQFKFSYVSSLFGSQLYTFLPYHFIRNSFGHVFLAAYYLIPLVIVVVWWLASGALLVEKKSGSSLSLLSFKLVLAIAICVLIGSSGVYYPFFSSFFLILSGVSASLQHKRSIPLLLSGFLVAIIFATIVITFSPSLVHIYKKGNIHIIDRNPADAETYGLKISQLLLPISGHRIARLAQTKWKYNHGPLFNENDTASLGFFGAVGFLALLGWIAYKKPAVTRMDLEGTRGLLNHFSVLSLAAVLLATVGGFGSFFAIAFTPQIRTYNRITVFIAFFSLLPIVVLIETIFRNRQHPKRRRMFFLLLVGFALFLGILDQTGPSFVPDYVRTKSEYINDAEFVDQMQTAVPTGAMIFQLPYVPFPESPQTYGMRDYELFRGYLHSRTLRWSYGAIKNREGDAWQRKVAGLPIGEFVQTLGFAGFSGIYLDRDGYKDKGLAILKDLSNALGVKPLISRDGRLVFFNMTEYNKRLREKYSEGDWPRKEDLSLHLLVK